MKKKCLLFVLFVLMTLYVRSQVIGGFDCKSPNALFDKEIYFVAYNQVTVYNPWTYSYVPQTLWNVELLVNGNTWYFVNGPWNYNTYITIDNVDFDKGSTVSMYSNGQYIATWACDVRQPTVKDAVLTAYKARKLYKYAKKALKRIK